MHSSMGMEKGLLMHSARVSRLCSSISCHLQDPVRPSADCRQTPALPSHAIVGELIN